MLKPCHLYPNPSKNITETDVSKLQDRDLCILLGGIKELAQIRGYTNVEYNVVSPSPDYVIATCKISWIPNYETEGNEVVFSAIGDASFENSSNVMGNYYLGPTAENRAFVRCVRSFLKINVVAKDELAAAAKSVTNRPTVQQTANPYSPKAKLVQVMKEKKKDFEAIKQRLVLDKYEGAEDLESVDDIPNDKAFEIIDRLQRI